MKSSDAVESASAGISPVMNPPPASRSEWKDFSVRGSPEELTARLEAALGVFFREPLRNARSAVIAASSGAQYRATLLGPSVAPLVSRCSVSSLAIAVGSCISDMRFAQTPSGLSVVDGLNDASIGAHSRLSPAEASDYAFASKCRAWFAFRDGALMIRSAHSDSDTFGGISRSSARALLSTGRLALANAASARPATGSEVAVSHLPVLVQVGEPSGGAAIGIAWDSRNNAATTFRTDAATNYPGGASEHPFASMSGLARFFAAKLANAGSLFLGSSGFPRGASLAAASGAEALLRAIDATASGAALWKFRASRHVSLRVIAIWPTAPPETPSASLSPRAMISAPILAIAIENMIDARVAPQAAQSALIRTRDAAFPSSSGRKSFLWLSEALEAIELKCSETGADVGGSVEVGPSHTGATPVSSPNESEDNLLRGDAVSNTPVVVETGRHFADDDDDNADSSRLLNEFLFSTSVDSTNCRDVCNEFPWPSQQPSNPSAATLALLAGAARGALSRPAGEVLFEAGDVYLETLRHAKFRAAPPNASLLSPSAAPRAQPFSPGLDGGHASGSTLSVIDADTLIASVKSSARLAEPDPRTRLARAAARAAWSAINGASIGSRALRETIERGAAAGGTAASSALASLDFALYQLVAAVWHLTSVDAREKWDSLSSSAISGNESVNFGPPVDATVSLSREMSMVDHDECLFEQRYRVLELCAARVVAATNSASPVGASGPPSADKPPHPSLPPSDHLRSCESVGVGSLHSDSEVNAPERGTRSADVLLQTAPPLCEDEALDAKRACARLGLLFLDSPLVRRSQTPALTLADMSAFRACRPHALLSDFLEWYGGSLGDGSGWEALWGSATPMEAEEQRVLASVAASAETQLSAIVSASSVDATLELLAAASKSVGAELRAAAKGSGAMCARLVVAAAASAMQRSREIVSAVKSRSLSSAAAATALPRSVALAGAYGAAAAAEAHAEQLDVAASQVACAGAGLSIACAGIEAALGRISLVIAALSPFFEDSDGLCGSLLSMAFAANVPAPSCTGLGVGTLAPNWAFVPKEDAARQAITNCVISSLSNHIVSPGTLLPAADIGILALASNLRRDWWPQAEQAGSAPRADSAIHTVASVATADGSLRLALSLSDFE
jgi:hypothetical protein